MALPSPFLLSGSIHSISTQLRLKWIVPPAVYAPLLISGGSPYSQLSREESSSEPRTVSSKSLAQDSQNCQITGSSSHDPSKATERNGETDDIKSAWTNFTRKFGVIKDSFGTIEWPTISSNIKNYIAPDWARLLPETVQKLQRELSMAPGSLADEIWKEAQDVDINPEIARDARVRVGDNLCPEEQIFQRRRREFAARALARYLDIKDGDIDLDDVPVIAMCGSGGGLRTLIASTGSCLAAHEAGLWDCVTYTAGVSGSCWLQALYNSSLTGRDFHRLVDHLKNRLGIHFAFPPEALKLLTTAPTNKYLLNGLVEKLKGDPDADFGLVDIYGLLLGARLLVPGGELDLSDRDMKLSNQTEYLRNGANPLPIYTAVRHEIPSIEGKEDFNPMCRRSTERPKEAVMREAWFQWFEFTPYEFFCEELSAGIPTWALGRRFHNGRNVMQLGENGVPELRLLGLMGIWGSAFCATLSHYYKEIRPVVKGLAGFNGIDSLIEEKNKDLIRVHPIDPGSIPNYVLGMEDSLPSTCPESIFKSSHLRLMDAGMSNNLPIYPLLRPGRNVDVIIAFDASADIKQENWLSVVDGYARQRGIQGWPIGAGWPKACTEPEDVVKTLTETRTIDKNSSGDRLSVAQEQGSLKNQPPGLEDSDLTYCNVWLGTKQERASDEEPPPSRRLFHPSHEDYHESDFELMRPDSGIAVVYFPFLPNPSAPDQCPSQPPKSSPSNTTTIKDGSETSKPLAPSPRSIKPDVDDFLSTWNFVYTPQQVDAVVGLAQANFAEGEAQVKRVVRGVYERKRRARLQKEATCGDKAEGSRRRE